MTTSTKIVFASSREKARILNNDLKAQGFDSKLYDGSITGNLGENGERWGAIYEVSEVQNTETKLTEHQATVIDAINKGNEAIAELESGKGQHFANVQEFVKDLESPENTLDNLLAPVRAKLGYKKPVQSGKRPPKRNRGEWTYDIPQGMHGKPYQAIDQRTLAA